MIRRAGLAAALAVAACPVSAKEAPWPSGIYGNVRMSAETGDLGGLEVQFSEKDGRHMVEYVLCEGWCNETATAELQRDGDGFVFDGTVHYSTDGERTAEIQHITLTPQGKKFLAKLGTGEDAWEIGAIKPVREPFGLAVARSEGEAADQAPD